MIKLDYTIQSPEERKKLVDKIVEENPDLSPRYLEILADYLVIPIEKEEKKQRKILTENRLVTVNKRETSYEGLASQLENGEDGIYSLINENKHTIFAPKISITPHDLETIPILRQLRESIGQLEKQLKTATGRQAYIIKDALIEMRKEQYIIKQAYQKPIKFCRITKSPQSHPSLDDTSYLNDNNEIVVQGVSLMDPDVVSAILCNYSQLKTEVGNKFESDAYYLLQSFDKVRDEALAEYEDYRLIADLKIIGASNVEIRDELQRQLGQTYSVEYISNLWRNKIPKVIAETAKANFLYWAAKAKGLRMKKCSRCGRYKPATNQFFSKNKTSSDGLYSICKACRNKKKKSKNKCNQKIIMNNLLYKKRILEKYKINI